MSVINETLDNLKKTKKRVPGSLNPSSSVHRESSVQRSIAMKSCVTPVSVAALVGVLMYMSYTHFFSPTNDAQPEAMAQKSSSGHTQAEMSKKADVVATSADKKEAVWVANPPAQGLYYEAMNLLNEGKEEQALQSLRQILKQYPDFTPAQKVYSMLNSH